jgi:hypothetical protein
MRIYYDEFAGDLGAAYEELRRLYDAVGTPGIYARKDDHGDWMLSADRWIGGGCHVGFFDGSAPSPPQIDQWFSDIRDKLDKLAEIGEDDVWEAMHSTRPEFELMVTTARELVAEYIDRYADVIEARGGFADKEDRRSFEEGLTAKQLGFCDAVRGDELVFGNMREAVTEAVDEAFALLQERSRQRA